MELRLWGIFREINSFIQSSVLKQKREKPKFGALEAVIQSTVTCFQRTWTVQTWNSTESFFSNEHQQKARTYVWGLCSLERQGTFKGRVHKKTEILTSFTHPHPQDFLSSKKHWTFMLLLYTPSLYLLSHYGK